MVLLLSICAIEALAQGSVHRQTDPRTGITIYRFNPSSHQRGEKSAASPMPRPPRLHQVTVAPTAPTEARTTSTPKLVRSSDRDFPRITAETQRARDMERLRILKHELTLEEEGLAQAIEKNATADVVGRHQNNIAALQREIHNVR